MSFHILFNYFPNAILGGQFISVQLLHCGRPRKCKRRHFLFRLITCLVTKPQYYSSLLSNKPGHFSKAGHFIFAKHSLFWQTFCQCYDSCPAYLNTIHFGPYIFNFGRSSPSQVFKIKDLLPIFSHSLLDENGPVRSKVWPKNLT